VTGTSPKGGSHDRQHRSAHRAHRRADRLRHVAGGPRRPLRAVADRETALGEHRLNGELTRTSYQLDLFADVAEDGAYLEATIDPAGAAGLVRRVDGVLTPVA
jgi:NADP-dependent aldehyde dehydrogenase